MGGWLYRLRNVRRAADPNITIAMPAYIDPVSTDDLFSDLQAFEEAHSRRTALKRRHQRTKGAVDVLNELRQLLEAVESAHGGVDHVTMLLEEEDEVRRAHEELAALLEAYDGGEVFKRCRNAWYEASGVCEFVKANDLLRQYIPAMARECAEAREMWEACLAPREDLKMAKQRLALRQGRFYALLELGLGPGASNVRAIAEKRDMWAIEEGKAREALAAENTPPILAERREYFERFHREQGWRKGAERFGELVGLDEERQLACRVAVLEADATHLRVQSKAALTMLAEARTAFDEAQMQLHASQGQIDFFSQLRERSGSEEELSAEKEEAELEVEVLRGTLEAYASRAREGLQLKLAWHAKVGAQKAGEALNAPNLADLDAAVTDAKRAADAAEPVRRDEAVLRGKLAKLRGKCDALQTVQVNAAGGVSGSGVRARAEELLLDARTAHLRHGMKVADLRLHLVRHDRAEASLHAAGGALVCLKRHRLAGRTAGARPLSVDDGSRGAGGRLSVDDGFGGSSSAAPFEAAGGEFAGEAIAGPLADDGRLNAPLRHFIRGCFGPMLRAAMRELIVRRPDDPYAFLASWLWEHSAANRYETSGAMLSQRDVDVRRRAVAEASDDLALVNRSLSRLLSEAEQVAAASAMLSRLVSGHSQREVLFNDVGDLEARALSDASTAWSVAHAKPSVHFANGELLDGAAAVLKHFPKAMLQVHVAPPDAVQLPTTLLTALAGDGGNAAASGGHEREPSDWPAAKARSVVPEGERVRRALGRLARRRAEAVTKALEARGVPARRLVATAPGYDLGMQPAGQLTIHELPEALQPQARARREALNELHSTEEDEEERREVEEEERALERLRRDENDAAGGQAMVDLLAQREAELLEARRELDELHAYAASIPRLAMPEPLTIVVSIVELSVPSARPLPCICLGRERVSERVAAFELADGCLDELDIELWAAGSLSGGPAERILGTCTLSISNLLLGAELTIHATLPVTDVTGLVIGSVRVLVEARPPGHHTIVPSRTV